MIELHRVYDGLKERGTHAFFVERLWPRGIKKDALRAVWLKDVAPSPRLRQWFQHDIAKWSEFRKRYRAELDANPDAWAPLAAAARKGKVTLLYSSRDTEHNSALVLRDYLNDKLKRR